MQSARRVAALAGVAGGVIVIFAFVAVALHIATDAIHRSARREFAADVRTARVGVSSELGDQIERADNAADQLPGLASPRRARLDAADSARAQAVLDRLVSDDGTHSAVITDRLGRVAATDSHHRLAIGTDLSGREWYRGISADPSHTYLSRLAQTRPSARPTVVAVTRIEGSDALLAFSQPAWPLGRPDDTTILDPAGVIAPASPSSRRLLALRGNPLARLSSAPARERTIGDRRELSALVPVGHGWRVLVSTPASVAYRGLGHLRTALVLGALVVAFLLLWLIPLVVARLGRARDALDASQAFQSDFFPEELPPGVRARYIASEQRMLLGGDFLDAARTPDDTTTLCIGDVCGHGPRAAALGATLRAAWRTLSFGPAPVTQLGVLERIVVSERRDPDLFATMAAAIISPLADHVSLVIGGHPPPLLMLDGEIEVLDGRRGPALGLGAADASWPLVERDLHGTWALVLYTDGVIEAPGPVSRRLGVDGLVDFVREASTPEGIDGAALVASVSALAAGRSLADDLAIIVVDGGALAAGSDRVQLRTTLFG